MMAVEIVNVEITTANKGYVAQTIEGGTLYSPAKGAKVTGNIRKEVADAIKTQTGATLNVKSTKLWSGDRFNVIMEKLVCTTEALNVEAEGSLELAFTMDEKAVLTGIAPKGSLEVSSADKKATFTAPADAGKVTLTFIATKQGIESKTDVEVTVTEKTEGQD